MALWLWQKIKCKKPCRSRAFCMRDNRLSLGVLETLFDILSRATPLSRWCYALCFAVRKTLVEQSAFARWQASLPTRFIWLSWISSHIMLHQICTKITGAFNAHLARQIGIWLSYNLKTYFFITFLHQVRLLHLGHSKWRVNPLCIAIITSL